MSEKNRLTITLEQQLNYFSNDLIFQFIFQRSKKEKKAILLHELEEEKERAEKLAEEVKALDEDEDEEDEEDDETEENNENVRFSLAKMRRKLLCFTSPSHYLLKTTEEIEKFSAIFIMSDFQSIISHSYLFYNSFCNQEQTKISFDEDEEEDEIEDEDEDVKPVPGRSEFIQS